MNTALRFTVLLLVTLAAAGLVWANSSNPPIGHTGAPGEPTCAAAGCHDQYPLNSGPGAAELPSELWWFQWPVCPDDTTPIPINVRQTGATRWGFELTVVRGSGQKLGRFCLVDSVRTQIGTGDSSYAYHTAAGTDAGVPDSSLGWTVKWVYDGASGYDSIKAYVAGVAADHDGTPQGDYVYTDSATIHVAIADPYCPYPGDVNNSNTATSQDIIYLINFIFRGGPHPFQLDMYGDLNCDGAVSSADIIRLVNYVFKGGWMPCLSCVECCLADDLTWSCP
jgi:hypothetical protein